MRQEHHNQTIEMPEDVVRALLLGRRAEAISLLRDATRIGPLAARRQIDEFIEHHHELEEAPVEFVADSTPQRLLLIAIIILLGLLLIFL